MLAELNFKSILLALTVCLSCLSELKFNIELCFSTAYIGYTHAISFLCSVRRGETKHIPKDIYRISSNVYRVSFKIIYVKAFLIHFLFLYSFRNETFINKKQPSFSWRRDLGGHEDDFPLGDISLLCHY